MATVNPIVVQKVGPAGGVDAEVVTWAGITAAADTVAPYSRMDLGDRSIQVTGTFGGATVQLQGSNDGVNYFALTTPAGATIQFTSAGLLQVTEAVLYVRPLISVDGSSPSITAVMAARRTMRGG